MRASLTGLMRTLCLTARFCGLSKFACSWFGPHGHGFAALTGAGTGAVHGAAAAADTGKKKKKQRSKGADEDAEEQQQKKKKVLPNHFVAVRVTDEEVKRKAQLLQEQILEEFPEQEKNLIPLSRFHFTLLVCRLEGAEELARARAAFHQLGKSVSSPESFRVAIAGVSSFPKGVLFAQVTDGCDSLIALANQARTHFDAADLLNPDPDPRPPKMHLTLAKSGRRGPRVSKACLARHRNQETFFGTQEVSSLQLCEMKSDQNSDYYRVLFEMNLRSGEVSDP